MKQEITLAPTWAINNKKSITSYKEVGCYHCLSVYSPKEITEFTDNNTTVICPKCHCDCVIPVTDQTLLKDIHDYWLN